jgi:ABC-type antimicrobial peptide transport system permease subunit
VSLRRILRTALRALFRNPGRAVLTTLGIVIGIGSVIAMMAIGAGSAAALQRAISSMGANNLMVLPGANNNRGVSGGAGAAMTLTAEDAKAVLDCPALRTGAPVVRIRGQVLHENRNWVPRDVLGSTPAYLDVRDWNPMEEGDAFTDADVRNDAKVCLLGKTLVRELFEGRSPLGQEVRIQNVAFRVIGVLRAKGANTMGLDQDDVLLAPWTTIKHRVSGANGGSAATNDASTSAGAVNKINQIYPNAPQALYPARADIEQADTPQLVTFANVDMILVAARSVRDIKPAVAQVTAALKERHRIRGDKPPDFTVRDMTEMANTLTATTDTMTTLLLCVASISLLVGGVGIMNIMLVTVTERTREIGLRMAVGAKRRDILRQFLIEALVLCAIGGALGIAAGLLGSSAVESLEGWPTETSLPAIALAVAVSCGVGILFGFYPAWTASGLDPVEALRSE